MCPGTIAEYGITDDSLTSVTATAGNGVIANILTKRRWALPAPRRTTFFWTGIDEESMLRNRQASISRLAATPQACARISNAEKSEALRTPAALRLNEVSNMQYTA